MSVFFYVLLHFLFIFYNENMISLNFAIIFSIATLLIGFLLGWIINAYRITKKLTSYNKEALNSF